MGDSTLLTILLPLVAALLTAALAVGWVVRPLFAPHPPPPPPVDERLAALLARKEAVLAAIRDLEFDHKVGKLTEEDFARYDARLRRQAIVLLQQIEQIDPVSPGSDEALEVEIASRRAARNQHSE